MQFFENEASSYGRIFDMIFDVSKIHHRSRPKSDTLVTSLVIIQMNMKKMQSNDYILQQLIKIYVTMLEQMSQSTKSI